MMELLDQLVVRTGLDGWIATFVTYALRIFWVVLLCVLLHNIFKLLLSFIVFRIPFVRKSKYAKAARDARLLPRLIHLIAPVVIQIYAPYFGDASDLIMKATTVYSVVVVVIIINAVLNIIEDIYRQKEVSKRRPIKGFLQIIEIAIVIILAIIIIASWMGQDPLVLLSGIGAFAAVMSFVFKDTLLGFVAGIQLSSNDMIRIGDWIEVPGQSIDGDVCDVSLISVTINNFDNTTSTIPAYSLLTTPFKNWRKMSESGARRIMRSVHVDVSSVSFCTDEMLDEFAQIELLRKYIEEKRKAGREPVDQPIPDCEVANSPHLTNLGVFRVYLEKYLKQRSDIRQDMIMMVRQLESSNRGIPLQIYAFSSESIWVDYEKVQADIFDHIYAIASVFELKLFQEISGNDLRLSPPLT